MHSAYTINTEDDGRWLYLYCPVCAAVYQVGPLDATTCPNGHERDHGQDQDGDR